MSRRHTWVVIGVLLAVQVALVLSQFGRRTTQGHDLPVALQGPVVVVQQVADRINEQPGRPLHARVLAAGADPRAAVRDDAVVATIVVDLDHQQNVLYLSRVGEPRTNAFVRRLADRMSSDLGQSVTVRELTPVHHGSVARVALRGLSALWMLLGLGLGIAWSVRSRRRSTRLCLLVAGSSLALATVVGVVATLTGAGSFRTLALVGALATYAAALGTVALDRLLGRVGRVVAVTVLVFFCAPLFSVGDPRLLGTPWRQVVPWTPHGATVALLLSATYDGLRGALRPVLVLLAIIGVSLVAMVTASRSVVRAPVTAGPGHVRWRLQALALALPVALTLAGAILVAPAPAPPPTAERVQGASETACVPMPRIGTIKQLNSWVQGLRSGPAFEGADVGADVRLQDGRRLWVFGDTLRAPDFDGQEFVRNSMLVLSSSCLRTVLPANHDALIPDRDAKVGYWPMSIAREARDGYDLVGVATQRVRTTDAPDGAFAFETLGPSMAVFVVAPGRAPQLVGQEDIGPDDPDPTRPMWGAAAAVDHGWAYLYGTARPDTKGVFGYSLRVARTRPDNLLRSNTWQYWDGHDWQSSPGRAAVLIPSDGGVSQTLSVFRRADAWYAVSKRDEVFGTDLTVWKSPSPTGPFDGGTVVARIPSDLQTGALRYMPLAHPTLPHEPGSVVVSYSRNNTDVTKVTHDPFLYRPEFLEVKLP